MEVNEDLDKLRDGLGKVGQAEEEVTGPTEPRGEMEKRLRKADAKGTLVEMANGDVVYIPVVEYTAEYFTAEDGDIDARYTLKAVLHTELCDIIREETSAEDPASLPMRFWLRKLYHIVKDNYPGLKAEELAIWVGDMNAENPVVANVTTAFLGIGKN